MGEKVLLRYTLAFDMEVTLGEGGFADVTDPHEAASIEELNFAASPEMYLQMLDEDDVSDAKFTVEP